MAQTNFTPILTYKSDTATVVPSAGNLTNSANGAELAVNTADKRLFTKDSGGNVVELGTNPSSLTLPNSTANGVVYANGSKVLTTGSALTFDGTNLGIGGAASMYWSGANKGLAIAGSTNGAEIDLKISGGTSTSVLLQDLASNLRLGNSGNFPIIFHISDTEQMRLTSTGLGIGTSSPNRKLEVNGISRFTDGTTNFEIACGGGVAYAGPQTNSPLAFQTNNTERMRLDSSGNLGIGTSSPAYKLDVNGVTRLGAGSPAILAGVGGAFAGGQGELYTIGTNTMGIGTTGAAALRFYTNSALQATLDPSGNLGLGVTPSAWDGAGAGGPVLQIKRGLLFGADTETRLIHNAVYSTGDFRYIATGIAATNYQQSSGQHRWYTAPSGTAGDAISFTQAMSLNADGQWLLNTTSPIYSNADAAHIYGRVSGGNQFGLMIGGDAASYTCYAARFLTNNSGAVVGSITFNTSATAYNTSSDYRLKNITGPITTSGAYIDSLNPVEGTWKADGSTFVGLIAHEVQEASRTTVATGVKDGEEMQGMDYSSAEIIANLIAEVKSLRQRLAAAGI